MRSHLIFRLALAIAVAALFAMAGERPPAADVPARVAAAGEPPAR